MLDKKSSISTSEWEVMRVIWTQNEATSKEICNFLCTSKNWKPTTVKTLLSRLVDKKMLETKKNGNKYIYKPLVEQRQSLAMLSDELLSKICATKVGSLLEKIIDDATLSFDDIKNLEKILADKKKDALNVIECNCIPGQCQCNHVFKEE